MSGSNEARESVKVGEVKIASGGNLSAIGLGSCVAIILYDPEARVGGVAHALLPEPRGISPDDAPVGRYASRAIRPLLEGMENAGAVRSRIFARLVGGASMFGDLLASDGLNLGDRNIDAARAALEEAGIPVRGEETGGSRGRTMRFDIAAGEVRITSLQGDDVVL